MARQCRRLFSHCEKTAINFLGFIKLLPLAIVLSKVSFKSELVS